MKRNCFGLVFLVGFVGFQSTSVAGPKVDGVFDATLDCPAYVSFNKGTNPGTVKLTPGESYEAIEVNTPGDYYWVRLRVAGASQSERWVSRECGTARFSVVERTPSNAAVNSAQCRVANTFDNYVLAISWQPGFCEHTAAGPSKPECKKMAEGALVVSHLTLHGLWPNKAACGTDYGKCDGPPLDLSDDTISMLSPWMPNFYYSTQLGQHEWSKHGTCQSRDDDSYFRTSIKALQIVDGSAVGQYVRDSIGGRISVERLKALAAKEAGIADPGILVTCANGRFLQEIRLGLAKDFSLEDGLKGLLAGGQLPKGGGNCDTDELFVEESGE